jgi:hypothetical protein
VNLRSPDYYPLSRVSDWPVSTYASSRTWIGARARSCQALSMPYGSGMAPVAVGDEWGVSLVATLPRRLTTSGHLRSVQDDAGKSHQTLPSVYQLHMMCLLLEARSDPSTCRRNRAKYIYSGGQSRKGFASLPSLDFFKFIPSFLYTVPCTNFNIVELSSSFPLLTFIIPRIVFFILTLSLQIHISYPQ